MIRVIAIAFVMASAAALGALLIDLAGKVLRWGWHRLMFKMYQDF